MCRWVFLIGYGSGSQNERPKFREILMPNAGSDEISVACRPMAQPCPVCILSSKYPVRLKFGTFEQLPLRAYVSLFIFVLLRKCGVPLFFNKLTES
jgi:hypothetical protein